MISVVVTIYNDERKNDVFDLIDSLEKQSVKNFQLVIVVEKSKTLFNSVLDRLTHTKITHEVIFSEGLRGISYARNLGVRHAKGDIIAFTDDDAILSPLWVDNIQKTFARHPEAIGVTGQAQPLWIDPSQSWLPSQLHWMVGCTTWRGWNEERATNIASGVNMAFRSEAFSSVSFREDMGAGASTSGKLWFPNEDNDYAMQLVGRTNRPIIFDPKVNLLHKVYPFRLEPKYIRKYAFWQGCAEAQYSRMLYSRGQRQSLQLKVFTGLISEMFRRGRIEAQKKARTKRLELLMLTLSFFAVGYFGYKFGMYRHIQHYV